MTDEPYTPEGHRLAPNPATTGLHEEKCDHCDGTGRAKVLPGELPRYCGSCSSKGTVQVDDATEEG